MSFLEVTQFRVKTSQMTLKIWLQSFWRSPFSLTTNVRGSCNCYFLISSLISLSLPCVRSQYWFHFNSRGTKGQVALEEKLFTFVKNLSSQWKAKCYCFDRQRTKFGHWWHNFDWYFLYQMQQYLLGLIYPGLPYGRCIVQINNEWGTLSPAPSAMSLTHAQKTAQCWNQLQLYHPVHFW